MDLAPGRAQPLGLAARLADRIGERGGGNRKPSRIDEAADALPSADSAALVPDGLEAFAVRALTARAAGRRLDLQYYAWHGDVTGKLLAREVLHAADRGVRVRLLLDDTAVLANEIALASLAEHENVSVRLFNATSWRFWGRLGFALQFLLGGWHLNHRMHNKAWIADGRVAITGGRNIGDAYFDASEEFNFRDLDMIVTGRAAGKALGVFKAFWRHHVSRSVRQLVPQEASPSLSTFRALLDEAHASDAASPYLERLREGHLTQRTMAERFTLVSARDLRLLADDPDKAIRHDLENALTAAIDGWIAEATRSVVLISPYFVPGRRGMGILRRLRERGVSVSIVTNSLAATDVTVVHGGYARYRRALVSAGVALYELKRGGHENGGVFGSRGASLHTKALLVDDSLVGVGSFNLDPRSANLNTEMGTFLRNATLARELRGEFERLIDPERSYRIGKDGKRLSWTCTIDGVETVSHKEPDADWWRRLTAFLTRLLPIESQL